MAEGMDRAPSPVMENYSCKELNGLELRVLEMQQSYPENRNIKRFQLGNNNDLPNGKLIIVGQTGAGKTTLVNVFINNILGVKFDDCFRYSVYDINKRIRSESESQTDAVTEYIINYKEGVKRKCNFVFVDTPGLGDTRGLEVQKENTQQILNYISKQSSRVALVIHSSANTLTAELKNILLDIKSVIRTDKLLSLIILSTFATSNSSSVKKLLDSVSIPYSYVYLFNNNALYCKKEGIEETDLNSFKNNWIASNKSIDKVLDLLSTDEDLMSTSQPFLKKIQQEKDQQEKHRIALEKGIKNLEVTEKQGVDKAPTKGSAVTIYSGNEAYMEKLRQVLDQDGVRDLPIVVIPVAGEYRTGKSFLLSYFLRYLTSQSLGSEDDQLVGFDHKYSAKSVTQGIKVWDQPLIVKEDGSNQKIVVLLMDSQGILGGKGDKEEATRIFALTTMISSIMVFNLMGQLNEGVLSHLEMFTAYAKQATAEDTDGSPFQKLFILIRDWAKYQIHNYGLEGGQKYFEEYFEVLPTEAQRPTAQPSTEALPPTEQVADEKVFGSYFKEIKCYLMPKPGDCVDELEYNGRLFELRKVFKQYLKELTEGLLKPEHLVKNLKEVTGNKITAGDFCKYFEDCTNLMANVDWNQTTNMLKMNTQFNCEIAKKEALVKYVAIMEKKTASFINMDTKEFMTEEELAGLNRRSSDEAQNIYGVKGVFARKNDLTLYDEYETKLIEELKIKFSIYEEELKNVKEIKRNQEELNQADAIGEAKKTYKADMDRETTLFMTTASKTFLEDGELKGIDNNAQAKAIKNYEDKCKANDIMFHDKYRENKKKLTKELEEESKHYACVQDIQRSRVKDKDEAERKRVALEKQVQKDKEEMQKAHKDAEKQRRVEAEATRKKQIELVEFFATTEGDNLGEMIWSGGGTEVSFGWTDTEVLTKGYLGTFGRLATLNTLNRIFCIVIYNVNPATREALEKEYKDNGDYMNMNLIKKVLLANNKTLEKTKRNYFPGLAVVKYHLWLD